MNAPVNKKYIDSPISAGFACIYIPSESLYLELNTHITEEKSLWITEIQKKYKVSTLQVKACTLFTK